MKTYKTFAMIILLIVIPIEGYAQSEISALQTKDAPTVALVLSGGAALGFAHIGVLKVLDELGIPIDMVLGTSMGGLIGGMYAIGYTPQEIEEASDKIDWYGLFMAPNSVQDFYLEPIVDSQKNILSFSFDEHGLGKSLGIFSDQKINSLMSELTAKVSYVDDFDELYIPLRTVAVDILTGDAVVFDSGRIVDALRATMSIPTLFPPYQVNGHYYIDGGVLNNLPVNVARELGADIVIAVSVSPEPYISMDEISSSLDVLTQSLNIVISATERDRAKLADILISPDLTELGRYQFWEYDEFIERGEKAAREKEPQLRALRDKIAQTRDCTPRAVDRVGSYTSSEVLRFDKIVLSTEDNQFPMELFDGFHDRLLSDLTQKKLVNIFNRIVNNGRYSSITYRLVPSEKYGSAYDLELNAIPSDRGRNTIGIGARVLGGFAQALQDPWYFTPAVTTSLVFTDLFNTHAYASFDAWVSEDLYAQLELFAPLGSFIYFHPSLTFYNESFSTSETLDTSRSIELSAKQNVGVMLGKFTEFGLRLHEQLLWLVQGEGDDTSYDTAIGLLFGPSISWKTTKESRFIHEGIVSYANLDIPLIAGNNWYERFCLSHNHFIPVSYNGTLSYNVFVGSNKGDFTTKQQSFDIGGWDGIPGYLFDHMIVDDAFLLGLQYQQRFGDFSDILGLDFYGIGQIRVGNGWDDFPDPADFSVKYGASLGLGVKSFLGDVILGIGMNQDAQLAYYLVMN